MKVIRHPVTCPFCHDTLPLATSIHGDHAVPLDGDVSLCFSCGLPGIFDQAASGGVRKPDKQEADEIIADAEIVAALTAWRIARSSQ